MRFGCWGFDGGRSISLGRRPLHRLGRWRGRRWGVAYVSDPDQHVTILIHCHALGFDEFILQHLKGLVIELELKLQRSVGDPSSLPQKGHDLIQHVVKVHLRPSTCASAASAWGSQK